MQNSHVDSTDKHLLLTSTFNAVRVKWSTNIKVGGMHALFIETCLQSYHTCQDAKWWDEVYQVSLEHLCVILDAIFTKYIILQRHLKIHEYKSQVVAYYRYHRGGNKIWPHWKTRSVKLSDGKGSRRERRSRLYDCDFQVKMVEPKVYEKTIGILKNKNDKLPFLCTPCILGINLTLMLIAFSYLCTLRLYLGPLRT